MAVRHSRSVLLACTAMAAMFMASAAFAQNADNAEAETDATPLRKIVVTKGVGEQTEKRLLIHYGSVPRIAAAPIEDLVSFLGKRELAERIHAQLNTNDDEIQREV